MSGWGMGGGRGTYLFLLPLERVFTFSRPNISRRSQNAWPSTLQRGSINVHLHCNSKHTRQNFPGYILVDYTAGLHCCRHLSPLFLCYTIFSLAAYTSKSRKTEYTQHTHAHATRTRTTYYPDNKKIKKILRHKKTIYISVFFTLQSIRHRNLCCALRCRSNGTIPPHQQNTI